MQAKCGRFALFSIGLVLRFLMRALRSRGSLERNKFVYRSCSGVSSFCSNNLTFHPSRKLEKSVLRTSLYRLNQESKHMRRQLSGTPYAFWMRHWQPEFSRN
ncbi:hypothetical protein CSKR_114184 [Clonorchis sinensis]|uniref:Uncharacterized protein n=1 Tax=Clonorchis sinensis TaxID=79923 RepID=A0A419QGW5_CLOSI|nr:hypothetical protein CSKR_114184 [Clonorchis sinensis]